MRPKRQVFPQYTRVFAVPWAMQPEATPLPKAVWVIAACQLSGKRTHRTWGAETTVPATDPLDVLCRLPDGTHELTVSWAPGLKEHLWPATWERVHLVDRQCEEDHSAGLWWIGAPCLDFVESGRLFQV